MNNNHNKTNNNNANANNNNANNKNNNKKPRGPKYIAKNKYFKVSTRDSNRIRTIKEGMNHLFDLRNRELEEVFLQEATQYTERVLGESRRICWTEEEDHEAMDVIFNNSLEQPTLEEPEAVEIDEDEVIDGQEEEILEKEAEEPEEESETLDSEEVWKLNQRIEQEDQEEYDRIRAEMEEEEAEANKNN